MNWTRPADLRAQAQKLWDRGELLSSLATDTPLFPKRLVLKCPTSPEMAERFDAVRGWISDIRAMPHIRVQMRNFRHRVLGDNAVPAEAWIDSMDDALALIGKRREAMCFSAMLDAASERQPHLSAWLARRPLQALALSESWDRLLAIVAWLQAYPKPGIYLRQADIPGVHSKFIEAHRGVLAELLDLALPADAIDPAFAGITGFARRYGFREKPLRVRFRMLDPRHAILPFAGEQDVTLDATSFAKLNPSVSRVFITENETNFLAFPDVANSLVVFGAGYGFDVLSQAEWLSRCRIYYWGDIDTHGFAILDQLRAHFGHAESFLMNRDTLMKSAALWGAEDEQTTRDLPRLNRDEQEIYNDLRDHRLSKNLRLEQERVGFDLVGSALRALLS